MYVVISLYFYFYFSTERSGMYPLKNREGGSKCEVDSEFGKDNDEMGDEEEDLLLELEADAKTGAAMTWPSEVYAYVKFGYDNTLKNQLATDGVSFNDWVNSVMTHVQAHYRHYTLPTKIQFKVIVERDLVLLSFYHGRKMETSNNIMRNM